MRAQDTRLDEVLRKVFPDGYPTDWDSEWDAETEACRPVIHIPQADGTWHTYSVDRLVAKVEVAEASARH